MFEDAETEKSKLFFCSQNTIENADGAGYPHLNKFEHAEQKKSQKLWAFWKKNQAV